jgi:RNA polymerase sigma factor (sigma-70 family)
MMLNNLKSFTRRYRSSLKREVSREVSLGGGMEDPGSGLQVAGPASSPSDHMIAEEEFQRLKTYLDRLPERDRLAVIWRAQEGSTYREIGERLGCSGVAARKLLMRVTEKLRRDMSASIK